MNAKQDSAFGHMIVLACGTRGDAQPLYLLAARLHQAQPQLRIDFATHAAHQEWLPRSSPLHHHWLPQPPARVWGDAASGGRNADVRQALLESCIAAVQSSGSTQHHPRLILCNCFSLEGFHIAEALGCPCIVASPCLVPYAAPMSFERRFRAAFPALYERLQDAGAGEVGWREVEHWMWPLFTESWQRWRVEALGMPPVPFAAAAAAAGAALPPPPPLLYGLSEAVVPRPAYWPASVHMCGFWLDSEVGSQLSAHLGAKAAIFVQCASRDSHEDPPGDSSEDSSRDSGLVAVDLGSMPRMGFLPDAGSFVAALRGALRAAGLRGLLLTGSCQPLQAACQPEGGTDGASDGAADGDVLRTAASAPHALLLPLCCAVVHHGGAGTTAAALAAGTPQLVCPVHFDQFAWAERVEDLGLGVRLPGAEQLLRGSTSEECSAALQQQLAALLRRLRQPHFRQRCAETAAALWQEQDGLAVAAQHIMDVLTTATQRDSARPAVVSPAVAALLAAHSETACGSPEANQTPAGNAPAGADLLQLALGFSVYTTCPDEARFIYSEIFEQRCYLRHGISVGASDVIVDCGANVGLFSLSLLLAAPPPASITAIEPLPPNCELLRRNLALHGGGGGSDGGSSGSNGTPAGGGGGGGSNGGGCAVTVLPVALGAEAAPSRRFTYYPHMPGNSTTQPAEKARLQAGAMPAVRFADQHTFECRVLTVSDVITQHGMRRIDLLKVDVEGSELDVLMGVRPEHWPLIRQVVAEVHDVDDARGGRVAAVQRLLQAHGFSVTCCRAERPAHNFLMYARRC